jgi:hypothetical protein
MLGFDLTSFFFILLKFPFEVLSLVLVQVFLLESFLNLRNSG